ncbi:MAG: dihydrolipoyl dehydrogenase [Thermoplasmata archaeon]
MKTYDLIVVGSGAGMNVASSAVSEGMKVAVVDNGPLGGTCLNRGCIPSKVMIYPADVIRTAEHAKRIGVHLTLERVDFDLIMKRTWKIVLEGRHEMEQGVRATEALDFYNMDASFVSDYTMRVGKDEIRADKIVIASGARPFVPPIEGLSDLGYETSRTIFNIKKPPGSLTIVGGGYIAAEFGHFFSSIGVKVTIIGRNPRLVPLEEKEISELLRKEMSKYCGVFTNHEVLRAREKDGRKVIIARNRSDGKLYKFPSEEILVAAGRRSNSDILKPENTGVRTDKRGWIIVDEYLQTTKENIWALGDAIGRHMFRHTANYESDIVWRNAFTEHKHPIDEHAVPHAVFTYPQVASVGLTEAQAAKNHEILVGVNKYYDVAKGYAMEEKNAFVKVIVERGTSRILGAHIIGPHAAILVQSLVYLMNAGRQDYMPLAVSQTIHPALTEAVVNAFGRLRAVGEYAHKHAQGN